MLISEDLPTFDLPINANSGLASCGPFLWSVEEIINSACLIVNIVTTNVNKYSLKLIKESRLSLLFAKMQVQKSNQNSGIIHLFYLSSIKKLLV
jgi:hypothetical protein